MTVGLPASPGASFGALAFTAEEAVEPHPGRASAVLLVRQETSPEDVDGMHSADGILTSTGGMTSHAAVVARGWGKCCVAGAGEISDRREGRQDQGCRQDLRPQGRALHRRQHRRGVCRRAGRRVQPKLSGDFATVMKWADKYRKLERPHERGLARRLQACPRLRCRGHRPVPYRAHVLRGRPHHRDA